MSCRPWEEPTPDSEPAHPVTPTKQSRNDGASRAHPDPGKEDFKEYLESDEFKADKVPVETAMCDNFKGWGNFAESELEITSDVCLPHGTGNVHYPL